MHDDKPIRDMSTSANSVCVTQNATNVWINLLPPNPKRIALILSTTGNNATPFLIGQTPQDTSAKPLGISLIASSGPVILTRDMIGSAITEPVSFKDSVAPFALATEITRG